MAKIPFSIDYKPQIESGEYKVFAHEHEEQEARIVCWDNKGEYPIVALVDNEPEKFDKHGRVPGGNRGGEFSLFIVTPGPELSEFENKLRVICEDAVIESRLFPERTSEDFAKKYSAELLDLAEKEIAKGHEHDVYIHEDTYYEQLKKQWEDGYGKGKAEVLKDLPRWRKWGNGACGNGIGTPIAIVKGWLNGYKLVDALGIQGEQYIMLSDLEKLPGFNEYVTIDRYYE